MTLIDSYCSYSNSIIIRASSGEYPILCADLVNDLTTRGLWTDTVRQHLIAHYGLCSIAFPMASTRPSFIIALQGPFRHVRTFPVI